jgi:hypothetical protein
MRITERKYLDIYKKSIGNQISKMIKDFDFTENRGEFEYLTKSSAVYSSNIEGNSIDLNSYMNYEMNKDKFRIGKEIEEIEDLIETYGFAQNNKLSERNLLNCHKIFSDTLLIRSKRGKYHQRNFIRRTRQNIMRQLILVSTFMNWIMTGVLDFWKCCQVVLNKARKHMV